MAVHLTERPLTQPHRKRLGAGRSGTVFLERTAEGEAIAAKVFGSSGVTKLVQWIFLGSPNPYVWSEDAVRCAVLRRRILADLVRVWFGPRLRVANASGFAWNGASAAFEIHTQFSPGRPAALHHPLRERDLDEARELTRDVLRPLQHLLIEAGFVGQVWQAGKGNPVALNNFLLESETEGGGWTWIDLESGVPALPSISPTALFGFYLPRAIALGRPLFDDVATETLRAYALGQSARLRERLGADGHETLLQAIAELEERQQRWKGMSRLERGVEYRRRRGQISDEEAVGYRRQPARWYGRELARAWVSIVRRLASIPGRLWRAWSELELTRIVRAVSRFLTSHQYRAAIAREYVAGRLENWVTRGQLSVADGDTLRSHLESEESSSYLTDFGIHLAIKPFVKSVEYWIFPALFALGLISGTTLAVAVLVGGAVGRTLYTGGRLLQSIARGREKPWVALGVGVMPVIGNLAYPLQLLWSSTAEKDALARFILYDVFTRAGRNLPVWGGRDSLTEHVFNRLPDRLPILVHSNRRGH